MIDGTVRSIKNSMTMNFKRILTIAMVFVSSIMSFAEDVKTSNGEVVGSCTIESSQVKYDRSGKETVWVKVKVKNNTGKTIRCTVYGNNGGSAEFIVSPYNSSFQYLENCHEQPSYLICDNARISNH